MVGATKLLGVYLHLQTSQPTSALPPLVGSVLCTWPPCNIEHLVEMTRQYSHAYNNNYVHSGTKGCIIYWHSILISKGVIIYYFCIFSCVFTRFHDNLSGRDILTI